MPRVWKIVLPIVAGAAIGAAIGYWGQCTSGTCVFTATWWGGAFLGALVGLILGPGGR
jgi:hypothetical protein